MSLPDLFIRVMDDVGANTALLAHCTPATIFRVGRTCHMAYKTTKSYVKQAYSIHRHLKHFFTKPDEFRALQARMHFVISGSNALQFMDRTFYPESDLDIYVTSRYEYELGRYIMEKGGKGYVFRPSSVQEATFEGACKLRGVIYRHEPDENNSVDEFHWNTYQLNRICGVFTFESTVEDRMVPLRIQIIAAEKTPLDCILSFHSTVVMNAITYHAAYSLYPQATFEENRTLVCDTRQVRHESALVKYKARGWEAERDIHPLEEADPTAPFQFGKRWVDDDMSWVLRLDHDAPPTAQYTSSTAAIFDPFSVQGWSLARHPDDNLPKTKYAILKPVIFEHMYTAHEEFCEKLRPWMAVQGRLQYVHGPFPHNGVNETCFQFDLALPAWRETYIFHCRCKDCFRLKYRRHQSAIWHWDPTP